jgi:uncharacterized membrane protein YfcA
VIYLVVCAVALLASALTFFSGFGLGTLLLPAFAIFFPVETAVASTAVVHFLNGVFKIGLVGRSADLGIVARFGIPAIFASFAGAWLLVSLAHAPPLATYPIGSKTAEITLVKIVIGVILFSFAVLELTPAFQKLSFPRRYIPAGGLASGFLGGLSGMQGALRTAFLIKAGLSKEAFIATGAVIAVLIDMARLGVYSRIFIEQRHELRMGVVAAATLSAFVGAVAGNALLKKLTMRSVQRIVAVMLALFSVALVIGVL